MTAFLRSRLLVFEVDTGSTRLNEKFRQFHDGTQSTMSRITVGDDRRQVVHHGTGVLPFQQICTAFLMLSSIMMQLGTNELIDLVGDGIHWVV